MVNYQVRDHIHPNNDTFERHYPSLYISWASTTIKGRIRKTLNWFKVLITSYVNRFLINCKDSCILNMTIINSHQTLIRNGPRTTIASPIKNPTS
jgi:hypothetical protein